MSNLNHTPLAALSDAEELISISSYDEMAVRPGFESDLNPKVTRPSKIIGHYAFRDAIRCGLSNCHHKHQKGYLVVTDDGRETNIGHICGKTHFGQDFSLLRNKYESRRRVRDYQERLGVFKGQLPAVFAAIKELRERERGAEWLYNIQRAFRAECPQALLDSLHIRGRTGDARVFKARLLEGEEADKRLAAENKWNVEGKPGSHRDPTTYTVMELVGEIRGLPIWASSIRNLLVEKLESELQDFEQISIFGLSEAKLRSLVAFSEEIPARLEQCKTLVENGAEFFTDANIAIVLQIAIPADAMRELRRKRWDSIKCAWKTS